MIDTKSVQAKQNGFTESVTATKKMDSKALLTIGLYAVTSIIIYLLRTSMFYALKGWILMAILFKASLDDIKKRECEDYLSVMILITALINAPISNIPTMLIGGAITFILQFVFAVIRPGRYGGADIKISSACSFLLGHYSFGLLALVIGQLSGAIANKITRHRNKSDDKRVPLVPYLSIGTFLAYLLAG